MKVNDIPAFDLEDFLETDKPYKLIYNLKDKFENEQAYRVVLANAKELDAADDFSAIMRAYEEKMLLEKAEAEERERKKAEENLLIEMRKSEAKSYYEDAHKVYDDAWDARDKAKRNLKITYVALGIAVICAVVNMFCIVV